MISAQPNILITLKYGQTTTLTYLSGPGGLYALHLINPDDSESLRYIHTDHLGSWTAISDETGKLINEQSFDAWGNRRSPATWTSGGMAVQAPLFDRGFTGHEHLDGFQLINMNGRMYDPVVSRMLAPDNFVQTPDFSQNFNRYSYALNNPLMFTDPSGEWIHLVVGAVVGGVINLAVNWNNIDSFWDGAGFFAIGAGAGALAAGTGAGFGALASGAGSFGFMSTAAISAPGLLPGIAVGVSSGFTSGFVTSTGNGLLQGETLGSSLENGLTDGLWGAALGGVIGGTTGQIRAIKLGLDPITGMGTDGKFGSVPDIARGSSLLDDPIAGLNTNGLRKGGMSSLVQDRLRPSLPSKISGLGEVNAAKGGSHLVYEGLDAAGKVRYTGVTGRDAAVRFGEHLNSGTARSLLDYRVIDGATGLSKMQTRIWEQTLINQYGLQKNGGMLLNKINSIAPKYWFQYGIKP